MSGYKTTRGAAGVIAARYENILRSQSEDYQDEMVIMSLIDHYSLCLDSDDDTILVAIERVLEDYMPPSHFRYWRLALKGKENFEEKQND